MSRSFHRHNGYFVVLEGDSKTHIIITKNIAKSDSGADFGMQIKRFAKDDKGNFCLAGNPYAGVYLTLDEWAEILKEVSAPK